MDRDRAASRWELPALSKSGPVSEYPASSRITPASTAQEVWGAPPMQMKTPDARE